MAAASKSAVAEKPNMLGSRRSLARTTTGIVKAMTTETENDFAHRADRLYAARRRLRRRKRPRHRFGIAEIVQFLNDPSRVAHA